MAPGRQPGHADVADQGELERAVRRDDDLAREVLVPPDGDLQDVLGPDPVFLDAGRAEVWPEAGVARPGTSATARRARRQDRSEYRREAHDP